jgi:hypothetical protein
MDNKLNLDGQQDIKYHGATVYAKNKVINHTGKTLDTESGFDILFDVDMDIINITVTNKHIVVFSTNNGKSEIGYYNIRTNVYTKVIVSKYLNFNKINLIHAISYYNYNEDIVLNFVDGTNNNSNKIRSINLMKLPFELTPTLELVDPSQIHLLNINPNVDIPNIDLVRVGNQGNLVTGSYILFVKYVYADKRETRWLNISNPVVVYKEEFDSNNTNSETYSKVTGNNPSLVTNKSIHFKLTNVDTNIKFVKYAILHSDNLTKTAFINTIAFNPTININIISTTTMDNISIEELLTVYADYTKAKAITVFQNSAVYGNLISENITNIQQFVNNVKTKWYTKTTNTYYSGKNQIISGDTYKNPNTIYYQKSFMPNEVVALYLRVFGLDGNILGDFHIPGRETILLHTSPDLDERTKTIDLIGTTYSGFEEDIIKDTDLNPNNRYFQTRCTATKENSFGGKLGYWDNANELYDDDNNWDIYSVDSNGNPVNTGKTLRNTNVRHHRIPSQDFLLRNNFISIDNSDKVMIGISVEDIKFPKGIREFISGYKLMYAVRTGLNNTVQDETILHRIYEYPNQCDSETHNFVLPTHNTAALSGSTLPIPRDEFVTRPFTTINDNNVILTDYLITNYIVHDPIGGEYHHYDDSITKPDDNVNFLDTFFLALSKDLVGNNTPIVESSDSLTTGNNSDYLQVLEHGEYIARNALSNNFYNQNGDTFIYFKTKNINGSTYSNFHIPDENDTSYANTGHYRNVTMMMYKDDCYIKFYNQDLAQASDFIPSINTTIFNNSADTIIGLHAYRNTFQVCYGSGITHGNYSAFAIPTYSPTNVELRHTDKYAFYPNLADSSITREDYLWDNYYKYNPTLVNPDFNLLAKEVVAKIFTPTNEFIFKFLYRFIVSDVNNSESLVNNWNNIKYNSYRDTAINKGEIISLNASEVELFIQKRNTLNTISLRDLLAPKSTDSLAIIPNSIATASINEVVISDTNGYIGTREYFNNVITKYGYCVVDIDKQKVFIVNNNTAKDITIGIQDELMKYDDVFKNSLNNPVFSSGLVVGYNDKDNMLLLSFSDGNCEPETQECADIIAKRITLSYSFINNGWVSFHDYYPDLLIHNRYNLFSVKHNTIYQHNSKLTFCTYYMNEYNTDINIYSDIVDYIFNSFNNVEFGYYGQNTIKLHNSFDITANIFDINNNYIYDRQVDEIVVYNDTQCTGVIDITNLKNWFTDNGYRIVNNKGHFNKLIDIVKDDKERFMDSNYNLINSNLGQKNFFEKSNFISTFIVIRLLHKNDKPIAEKLFIINVSNNSERLHKENTNT